MTPTHPVAEGVAAGAALTAIAVQGAPFVLGIPADVLLAACAGALFGLAYTKPDAWGSLLNVPAGSRATRMWWILVRSGGLAFTLCSVAIVSAWSVTVVPYLPLLEFTADIPKVPFAGVLAFAGQRVIPRALTAVERWLDRRNP